MIIAPFPGRSLLWLTNLIALGSLAATLAVLIASYTPLLAVILDKHEMIERLVGLLGDIRAALASLFIKHYDSRAFDGYSRERHRHSRGDTSGA